MNHFVALLYHALFSDGSLPDRYALSFESFEHQLKFFSKNGFSSLAISDIRSNAGLTRWKKKTVVITFDDGNESDYRIAYPLLKAYGFRAIFFHECRLFYCYSGQFYGIKQ